MSKIVERKSLARRRGVTLVEVLIVVAIMSVIAGMATVAAWPELKKAKIRVAATGAGAVREAATMYRELDMAGDTSACPTMDDLVAAKKIDAKKSADPWGTRYRVSCEDSDLHGISAGQDRKVQTPDDVRDDIKPDDVAKIAGM
jgi:general secretion pathway protein G